MLANARTMSKKHLQMFSGATTNTATSSNAYTKPKYSLTLHSAGSNKNNSELHDTKQKKQQQQPYKHGTMHLTQNTPFPMRNHLKVLKLTPANNDANNDDNFEQQIFTNQNLSPTHSVHSLSSSSSSSSSSSTPASPTPTETTSREHTSNSIAAVSSVAAVGGTTIATASSTLNNISLSTNLNANNSMNVRNQQQQQNRLWYH